MAVSKYEDEQINMYLAESDVKTWTSRAAEHV